MSAVAPLRILSAVTATPLPDLRARRRNATRIDIREAALALFEQRGADRTTVDEIAHAAGISPRTFFRYFATKEECVLSDIYGFDDAVEEFLRTADLAAVRLADVEAVVARVVEVIRDEQSDVAATVLRIQKLVATDATLGRAALARHADHAARAMTLLDGRCSAADRARIRTILKIAQLSVQLAFEEWVEAGASRSPECDLPSIYRAVCARLREL